MDDDDQCPFERTTKKETGNKYTQYFELFLLIKGTGSR